MAGSKYAIKSSYDPISIWSAMLQALKPHGGSNFKAHEVRLHAKPAHLVQFNCCSAIVHSSLSEIMTSRSPSATDEAGHCPKTGYSTSSRIFR